VQGEDDGPREGGREGRKADLTDASGLHALKGLFQGRYHRRFPEHEAEIFLVGGVEGPAFGLPLRFEGAAVVATAGREGWREGGREGGEGRRLK
jgi:hypothetical protein